MGSLIRNLGDAIGSCGNLILCGGFAQKYCRYLGRMRFTSSVVAER